MLITLAFMMMGNALRDALDVKSDEVLFIGTLSVTLG
jgi:hypothetical protein